jgi:hypothetical protein
MVAEIAKLKGRFLICTRVTKRPVFLFVSSTIRPGDALQTFMFDDDYSFGILQSYAHWTWFITKCSKLTKRFRYTPESVFDTFPWPQSPTKEQIDAVAHAGRLVRNVRSAALQTVTGGFRAIYRTLELPGKNALKDAHTLLDKAVLSAYNFSGKEDILAQLLSLNLDVASKIDSKQLVTSPGIPPSYEQPADLISDDCIKPVEV